MDNEPLLATEAVNGGRAQKKALSPAGSQLSPTLSAALHGNLSSRARLEGLPPDIEMAVWPIDEARAVDFVAEGNAMVRHRLPKGLPLHNSASLGDYSAADPVPWGSTVRAVDLGHGWAQSEHGFLPMRISGMRVLKNLDRAGGPAAANQALPPFAGGRIGHSQRALRVYYPSQEDFPEEELEDSSWGRQQSHESPPRTFASAAGGSTLPSAPLGNGKKHASTWDSDIVQFTAPVYFVEEEEGRLTVDVMRIGSLSGTARCQWETLDASAEAGVNYHAGSGEIVFQDGQHLASIDIEIIQSEAWAATLEFKVKLSNPDNCELGLFLYLARVKLIDADYFPTNKYKNEIMKGIHGIESIPQFALMWEFIRMNYDIPGVRWRTWVTLTLDQMNNMYLYFILHVTVYFTDVLFADHPKFVEFVPLVRTSLFVPGSRNQTAIMLGILYVLPMILLHMWDYAKVGVDLGGTVRNYLRANLFRKYLNYSEATRNHVQASDMQAAIMEDARDASDAYTNLVEIIRISGRLAIILYFTFHKNPGSWMILVLMPCLMLGWVRLRGAMYLDACEKEGELQLEVAKFVHRTCESYTIIAEYMQRPQMNELFYKTLSAATHEGRIPKQQIETNNQYFPKWLGPLFVGIYIATTAAKVVEGVVSIGTFMATVSVLRSISGDFGEVYKALMQYNVLHNPVIKLVDLFNRPTDVRAGKAANRERRELTKSERLKVRGQGDINDDLIPIKLVDMSFCWKPNEPQFSNLSISVPQGTCVAVMSNSNCGGRATLLRLIGQRFQPTDGNIFIPTHLRVLHVSSQPLMIEAPIFDNLVFGAKDCPRQRVYQILEDMDMTMSLQAIKSHADEPTEGEEENFDRWQVSFPYSELAKIHLARAFIMSPEVCVMQRPFSHFSNKATCQKLMSTIMSMVSNRGVRLPPETVHRRRPRTCFLTPEEDWQAEFAHEVWHIEASHIHVRKMNSRRESMQRP